MKNISDKIECYISKRAKLSGSNYKEVEKAALKIFKILKSKTKRTPYVRSKYFHKAKIFLNIFWQHLHEKRRRDRMRRLKLFSCAIDLIEHSNYSPEMYGNYKQKDERLHRFLGSTKDKELFIVQIKENKRTGRKDLISIFPL